MPPKYIDVRALTLREIFSGEFVFCLPWFQRAYAWQTDQVSRLLSDLFDALRERGKDAEYFLGTLLVCKPNGSPTTSLIDGHQRTMTFTILFSVLRDLCDDAEQRANLSKFIRTDAFHLQPNELQAEFCQTFVQNDHATEEQPEQLFENLSFTERNILVSRDHIRDRLSASEMSAQTRLEFAEFLADRCHVIVHIAPDEDEAWNRLRKEEETRLTFAGIDLAKESVLALCPPTEREVCSEHWEHAKGLVGGDDLYAILNHLRALKGARTKNKPLEEEIAKAYELNTKAIPFVRDTLVPTARQLRALRQGEVGPRSDRARIAQHCEYMCWINQHSWLPPALLWLSRYGSEHRDTGAFFAGLERLFWLLNMSADDKDKIPARLNDIAQQIQKGRTLASIEPLNIERRLKAKAMEKLRAQHFDRRSLRAELMRRISVAMGQDPGPIDGDGVTVEHILPRSWRPQNAWRTLYPNRKKVDASAHRLGNLTFLSQLENHAADSADFEKKRAIYGQSHFNMTRELAALKTWTPEDINARTERLIKALFDDWRLPVK